MGFLDDIKKSVNEAKIKRDEDSANPRIAEAVAMASEKLKRPGYLMVRGKLEAIELGRMLKESERLVTMVLGNLDRKKGIAALTSDRIIFVENLGNRRHVAVFPLEDVDTLSMSGVINVKIEIGSKRRKAQIDHAAPFGRPAEFVEEFFRLQPDGPRAGKSVATSVSTGATALAEQLSNLAELHGKGLLSDDEFAAAKRKTIGS